jgi:hypothetical protein
MYCNGISYKLLFLYKIFDGAIEAAQKKMLEIIKDRNYGK